MTVLFPHLTSNKLAEVLAEMIVEKSITVCTQMKFNFPSYCGQQNKLFITLKSQLIKKKNNLN
jgi:hypothetical protein